MKLGTYPALVVFVYASMHQLTAASADESKLTSANNNFAFKLLQQLVNEQPGSNIFISPYSASTVLQMVGSGAAGQTKKEMDQVLGTGGMSADAVGVANKSIAQSLNSIQTNVILVTANSIWYHRDIEVKADFLSRNRESFGATIAPLDFADPHCGDVINAWAGEKTRGRITRIADGMIDPLWTRLFLANAVYFKGKWDDPFDVKATKERLFHLRGGRQKNVPMMTTTKTFTYRRGTGYQAVRLPYQGCDLAMYVLLPDTNSSPEKLLGIMTGDVWQRATRPGFRAEKGTLGVPKFKLEYGVELKQPLRAMGMKAAFGSETADFSGIASQLYISAVRQKTFVEVNEEGTEAAAVTGIAVDGFSLPPPDRFQMIVDRPFLFLIEDTRTGTILFMGAIFNPSVN